MASRKQVEMIKAAIAGPRGEVARQYGAEVREIGGKTMYVDRKRGHERRITLAEMFGYLHGEDIRAIKAAL